MSIYFRDIWRDMAKRRIPALVEKNPKPLSERSAQWPIKKFLDRQINNAYKSCGLEHYDRLSDSNTYQKIKDSLAKGMLRDRVSYESLLSKQALLDVFDEAYEKYNKLAQKCSYDKGGLIDHDLKVGASFADAERFVHIQWRQAAERVFVNHEQNPAKVPPTKAAYNLLALNTDFAINAHHVLRPKLLMPSLQRAANPSNPEDQDASEVILARCYLEVAPQEFKGA